MQVGSGPSGLVLALSLAKNDIPVRVIEKNSGYHVGQRGSGLHPRTLELYGFLGVLPDITKNSIRLLPRCIYEMPEGREPSRIFDLAPHEEPTPFIPYVCTLPQYNTGVLTRSCRIAHVW